MARIWGRKFHLDCYFLRSTFQLLFYRDRPTGQQAIPAVELKPSLDLAEGQRNGAGYALQGVWSPLCVRQT